MPATDFVPVNQSDVLVITHSQLRTPGWYPGMSGAWETELLYQKDLQGYDVALYEIQDGVDQTTIRSYIVNNQGSFQFVYILGDARRPEPEQEDPENPTYPTANFSYGHIVPIWREVVQTYWVPYNGLHTAESDRGYIDGITGVSIGRIPVETGQEILDYLSKSLYYISIVDQHQWEPPPWSHYILEALDDNSHLYNMCSGAIVRAYTNACEKVFADGWPTVRLATSIAYANPNLDEESERHTAFEYQLNAQHYGLIHILGSSGAANHLVDWYFGDFQHNLTNFEYLPFMLGMSCDLGGFDQYENEIQKNCVIEKMLLNPDGGIVASVTATGPTLQRTNGKYAIDFWKTIFDESYTNFGEITNRSIEVRESHPSISNFILKMFVLLGDPTLNLPYAPFAQGQ